MNEQELMPFVCQPLSPVSYTRRFRKHLHREFQLLQYLVCGCGSVVRDLLPNLSDILLRNGS